MFNLPGRGFRQRITLTSSVPMTLNDVIVHARQFVNALVSVNGCSSFPDPDGFLDVPDFSVGFLVYNILFPQSMMWFSVVAWSVRADLLMVDINLFSPLLVYFSFFVLSTSFLCSSSRVLVVFLSPQCTQHHSSCMVFGTPVHHVLLALLCPCDVPTSA